MEYIKWFEEISIKNIPEVGGKTASIGEMYKNLKLLSISLHSLATNHQEH